MKVSCFVCKKAVEVEETTEIEGVKHCDDCLGDLVQGKEKKPRKPRELKKPAKWSVFKLMTASEAAEQYPHDTVFVHITLANGPELARKEVEKQKVSGTLCCYRGPVWRDQYGIHEVFGLIK